MHRIHSSCLIPKVMGDSHMVGDIREKTWAITNGGSEAESWQVRTGGDFRNEGLPVTLDKRRN